MKKDPKYLDTAFEQVTTEITNLFIKKHKDYGKQNILDIEELGIAFRTSEKIARIKHLLKENKKPLNESIEENWLDIAVYAVIAVLYKRGWFQKLKLSPKKSS